MTIPEDRFPGRNLPSGSASIHQDELQNDAGSISLSVITIGETQQKQGWQEDHLARVQGVSIPRAGVEPARPCGLGILSPLCLPFHHPGRVNIIQSNKNIRLTSNFDNGLDDALAGEAITIGVSGEDHLPATLGMIEE